jgi:hypothetical protein
LLHRDQRKPSTEGGSQDARPLSAAIPKGKTARLRHDQPAKTESEQYQKSLAAAMAEAMAAAMATAAAATTAAAEASAAAAVAEAKESSAASMTAAAEPSAVAEQEAAAALPWDLASEGQPPVKLEPMP